MSEMPRSRALDQRYYGVVEALVTDVDGDPEKEGRIKVKFLWFDGGETISDWCRVAQIYAGNGYGAFFLPEVNDEVLVSFVHGDMRMPIVIGKLYNGKDKPTTHREPDRDQKLIRTKGGHLVLLDDSQGEESIRIQDKFGNVIEMASDHIAIHGKGTIEIKGPNVIINGRLVAPIKRPI